MTKKLAIFLLLPLFAFATIEISTQTPTKKEERISPKKVNENKNTQSPAQKRLLSEPSYDDLPKPEADPPVFFDGSHQKQFIRTLIFICVIIILAMIIVYVYKKGAPMSSITKRNSGNNIKILERRSLSAQTYLYHIQVGDKQFILSESKVEVRNVSTLDWPDRK